MGYIAKSTAPIRLKAFLVGCCDANGSLADVREYLAELGELVDTLGVDVCGEMSVRIREPNPKFYIGSGKAEELKEAAAAAEADVIIFDDPLGPSQQRNLEKLCRKKVIDRQEVILDIFADRAQTREAVLQVELARCHYFLPRLTGAWSHLSRQRGGGTGARGDGEKQIEYDRRQLKDRISELERELEVVRKQRSVQRKGRLRNNMPSAAIVGYTNAGKSTLLNTLTASSVLAEDKLFATLDPTTRRLVLPDNTEVLLTDTVGFVRKLPHALVEAFKSTLEEAVLADFILLILDVSNPQAHEHWETTLSVLHELGAAEKNIIAVFNKMDLQPDPLALLRIKSLAPDALFVSCKDGTGLDALRERLMRQVNGAACIMKLEIPPEKAEHIALLHAKCRIFESNYCDDGKFYAVAKIAPQYFSVFDSYSVDKQKRSFNQELITCQS